MGFTIWSQWARCRGWWRNYRRWRLAGASSTLALLSLYTVISAQSVLPTAGAGTPLLAVGDIADCQFEESFHDETSALVDTLAGQIAILGDIAYPEGSDENFAECYDPAWGRHMGRVRPVPGNHEYATDGAAGYFNYFGAVASPQEPACRRDCLGYYSYDVGYWHIIALNSEISMTVGSAQEVWLRADLATHRTPCTLAYWHRPLFSSGEHGGYEESYAVWAALYEYGVEVVLNGHDHNYERFAPQTPAGEVDLARGIRQFIVGTGGAPLRDFGTIHPNSDVRHNQVWGVLELMLHPDHYAWTFRSTDGERSVDGGSASCVRVAGDWEPTNYLPWLVDE